MDELHNVLAGFIRFVPGIVVCWVFRLQLHFMIPPKVTAYFIWLRFVVCLMTRSVAHTV